MNFREKFLNDLSCKVIIKGDKTFKQLAKLYGYPQDNGANLCKKDYYKFIANCEEQTTSSWGKVLHDAKWLRQTDVNKDGVSLSPVKVTKAFTTEDSTYENLVLKSKWQVQTKGGNIETLKSYKNDVTPVQISKFREDLINDLKKTLELAPINYTPTNNTVKSSQVFFISDLHIGMDSEGWDVKSATDRVLSILNRINNTDKVIVVNLGDTIDGLNGNTATKSTHTLPQNLSNSKQIIGAVEVFKVLFDNLNNLVQNNIIKQIEYYSVSDSNHSGDMELVVSEFMQLYLNTKYPYIKVNNSDDYWNYLQVDDFNILISHGKDSKNMKFGLPLNLDYKTENYLTQLVNSKGIQLNPNKTLIVSGDLHTESFNQGKFFKYYKMPAISPPSTWVKMNYGDQVSGLKYFTIAGDILTEGLIAYGRI